MFQRELTISPNGRGLYEITEKIQSIVSSSDIEEGLCNVFIKHTSASLTINEDADPTVRVDFESHFNQIVPENQPYYKHTFEGSDDMPAHLKASLLDSSLSIPISNGKLVLGTWQGIYLCEHRNHGRSRNLVATVHGE